MNKSKLGIIYDICTHGGSFLYFAAPLEVYSTFISTQLVYIVHLGLRMYISAKEQPVDMTIMML